MIGVRREAIVFFFLAQYTLSSHRKYIKLNLSQLQWVSKQELWLFQLKKCFKEKSIYFALKQDHTATQHLYSFYCLLIRKKICRILLLRPSRTRSLTFSPWKSCPFVFLRRHSLLCGFLSTSYRRIGNINFFVTEVVAWLRDEKTLELKSDYQLEYARESSDTNRTPSWNKSSSTVLEQFILTLCNRCLSNCRYSVEINESSSLIGWMTALPRKVTFLCVLTRVVINSFWELIHFAK